jgi:cytochrome b pre-mRNA-processing protein 3
MSILSIKGHRVSIFERLSRTPPHQIHAEALYASAVDQARKPEFYSRMGVPDAVDGRFDMIALHVFMLLRRLKGGDGASDAVAQALFDTMFEDMDRGLRELGAGDLGVGRRVKVMAKAFYGRISAYEQGLAGDDDALMEAVQRNVFRGDAGAGSAAAALASYIRAQVRELDRQRLTDLLDGKVTFLAPADMAGQDGEA